MHNDADAWEAAPPRSRNRLEQARKVLGISPLRHHQIDRAFPLMQAALPRLTLGAWRQFANRHRSTRPFGARGIMIGTAPNGTLRAAFFYAVVDRRRPDRTPGERHLVVCVLVLPVLGRELAVAALARTMQNLARAHHCAGTLVHLPADANWELGVFRRHGFEAAVSEATHCLKFFGRAGRS